MLIGNKKDPEFERQISFEEANDFALLNNYIYMETSSKRNENVYEAFEKAIEIALIEKKKEKENQLIEKVDIKLKKKNKLKKMKCILI